MKAFPLSNTNTHHIGMDLRDYFAAKAMQALLSDADWREDMEGWSDAAFAAYKMADAMMKVRKP